MVSLLSVVPHARYAKDDDDGPLGRGTWQEGVPRLAGFAAWAWVSPNEDNIDEKGIAEPELTPTGTQGGSRAVPSSAYDVGAADARGGAAAAGHADPRVATAARAGIPAM